MIFVIFAALIIAAVICTAAYLERLATEQRRADINRLRDDYAAAQRRHMPSEHIRRDLVLAVCRELQS